MKTLLLSLLFSNLLFANIGKITSLAGDVFIIRDNKEVKANIGFVLKLNDQIKTKDNSKALLLLKDQTSINVGKKSTMSINDFVLNEKKPSSSKAKFRFGKGLFRTITGKIGKLNPKKFKIKTKTASIGIRGTGFDVVVSEKDTKIAVFDGEISLTDPSTNKEYSVKVGEKIVFNNESKEATVSEGSLAESNELGDTEKKNNKEEEKQEENKKQNKDKKIEEKQENRENKETAENKGNEVIEPKENNKEETSINSGEVLTQNNDQVSNLDLDIDVNINEITDNTNKDASNNAPTLIIDKTFTLKYNENKEIKFSAIDIDGDALTYLISQNPKNGVISLEDGKIIYKANEKYVGQDSFIITVRDSKGEVSSQIVTLNVEKPTNINPTKDLPVLVDLNNLEKLNLEKISSTILGDLNYMEFGFIKNDKNEKIDTYYLGTLTPTSVIENYILEEVSASYTGNIAAIIKDNNNNVKETINNGIINLNFDFKNKNLNGNININENWRGNINNGTITPNGFSSTNISSSNNNNNMNGSMIGNFYGSKAQGIAGKINLNGSQGSVNASFAGVKDER